VRVCVLGSALFGFGSIDIFLFEYRLLMLQFNSKASHSIKGFLGMPHGDD
jgi:hypothetical protein